MGRLLLLIASALILALTACGSSGPSRSGGEITLVEPDPDAHRFVLRRSTLEAALDKGPSWFIQRVRVDPVVVGDRFYGFRILGAFEDQEDFDRDALKEGDIVQRVNGQPIGRPDEFMRVWESLDGADHLALRILRDGRPMRVTWVVEEDAAEAEPRAHDDQRAADSR